MEEKLLYQLFMKTMELYDAEVTFGIEPKRDPVFWAKLTDQEQTLERTALKQIADCMRRDTTDFDCVEDILDILFSLGYKTDPRHDFG